MERLFRGRGTAGDETEDRLEDELASFAPRQVEVSPILKTQPQTLVPDPNLNSRHQNLCSTTAGGVWVALGGQQRGKQWAPRTAWNSLEPCHTLCSFAQVRGFLTAYGQGAALMSSANDQLKGAMGQLQRAMNMGRWDMISDMRPGMGSGIGGGGLMADIMKRQAFATAKALIEAAVPSLIKVRTRLGGVGCGVGGACVWLWVG